MQSHDSDCSRLPKGETRETWQTAVCRSFFVAVFG